MDFLLTRHRDIPSPKRFFKQAISHHPCPLTVIMDRYAANHSAVDSFNARFSRYKPITIRQNKYLNNRIEQDHRGFKRRIKGMLRFKSFHCARILLAGIELMHILRENQFSDASYTCRSIPPAGCQIMLLSLI
ncbi:DDE-type integrase/transposase/recombinase [Citrobacter portucalensis]|uniref:DDE-type integrase/transposase/recombinase n=1 Tax=Citrobacter portucalensis TaxID=1639133 RepID=UPI0039FC9AB9